MAESLSMGSAGLHENLLDGSLNIDLEELDDEEFDIPPVEHTPTLESILNDVEDQASLSEDEVSNSLIAGTEGVFEGSETVSLGSVGSRSWSSSERRHARAGKWCNSANGPHESGCILRHIVLKGISSQLVACHDQADGGRPTAMAAATMVAVGTSRGLVLVFDAAQALRWRLGPAGREPGSVSSLGFNGDCSRLLAGYARGDILMFDLQSGRLLRTVTDAHPPGTAVLHVKFTDLPTLALCSDSGGSVFELSFRRTMGVRGCDSKCLFSGSRGEVCCIEPLLLQPLINHPLRSVVLVAMATLSKVIVVSIRPRMKVLFTHSLQASPATLPLITWQFVIIQMADTSRVIDPVLAFARESTIHFFQVSVDARKRVRFAALQKLSVGYELLGLHWLNARTLAAVDVSEQLRLLDVRSREELEAFDLSPLGLVYGSGHFKGLATGGNVSQAMAYAGERACYNSIVGFGNQVLILGTKSFHVLTIRSWNERLNFLVKQNRYLDALSLGMAFYLDKGKAVIGLKGSKEKRKELTRDKVLEILNAYIDDTLVTGDGSTELYYEAIPACIEYCIELDVLDTLFNKLWDACTHQAARACYLHSLEPWILNDRVPNLPPVISQEFVSYYESKGFLQALEACLVHLEVTSIDIDQVMRLCWTHGLYDGIIHIHNRGMKDYVTPLQELMPILQAALSTGKQLTDGQIVLGNKLLVYISCCLAGRAYPTGDIPEGEVQGVKYEVFKCLTSLHSKDAADSELPYPYLRTLLQFDTREFLNVLALAFEEPEFTSELGLRQVQRLVDILLLVMVKGSGFMPSQVGSLFTFLARQLAKPWCGLHVDRQLFEQVVEFLTESSGSTSLGHHEERQQALLELMRVGGLQHFDQDRLLRLADGAGFYRVCELLYERRREHHRILQCYLRDPLRRPQVFSFLHNLLAQCGGEGRAPRVEAQVLEQAPELLDLDAGRTAQLVCAHLPRLVPAVVERLHDQPRLLLAFLRAVFQYREGPGRDDPPLEPRLAELHIALLCDHAPGEVLGFLAACDGYRLDEATAITRARGHAEATAFLLERAGDHRGALALLLGRLERAGEGELAHLVARLQALCQRASASLDERARQEMWFSLLECVMRPQRDPARDSRELKDLTQQLLMCMSSHVSLPAMLQFILKDPAYTGGKFGDIRELMMGMLSNSCYEETLLQVTSRLLSSDLHHMLARELALAARGVSPQATCAVCHKPLGALQSPARVVVFRCRHSYHSSCRDSPRCYVCSRTSGSPDLDKPSSQETHALPPQPPDGTTDRALSPDRSQASTSGQVFSPASNSGLLQSEDFALKLSPPPPPDLEGLF
ncbi:vacuolar protein sorting-associated protein 8 homolog [Bacillus rossius redtenbacheri]|uniref:vacuolar protein sorting-associated protein 8 homolog n=1 Tax=Bacillus rossius redtenbacheri TaxID=93214 RepID=UPI002FDCB3EE